MRPLLLTILLGLYALAGVAFAAWTGLGHDASPDSKFALPLPAWAMTTAAAGNLLLAAGIWWRVAITRHCAFLLHAAIALLAVAVTGKHLADGDADAAKFGEMAMKFGVHAAVAMYWWRSRATAAWFAGHG